jgi:molybdate transport system permease protein
MLHPLWISLQVATLATLAAAAVGTVLAGLLSETRLPGREWLAVLVTSPVVMPPTVLGYYLLVVLGRQSVVGRAFETLTGSPIVFTRTGAVVAAFVSALPFVVNAARAALESVDRRYIAAARSLGAGRARVFWTISVPLAIPGIAAGVMLGFARALGEFGVTLMLAGNIPGETRTASLAIYDAVQAGRDDDAALLAGVLTVIAAVVLYGVSRLTRHRVRFA